MKYLTWLQKNLFSNWYNTLLTIVCLFIIYCIGSTFLWWAFTSAQWRVITINLPLLIIGRYPEERIGYLFIALGIIVVVGALSWIKKEYLQNWLPLISLLTFMVVVRIITLGVKIDLLSGLILTILVAVSSIVISFPFGLLLALGRQSDLPVIRWLSIAYIEILRGLPLIGILFMAQVMLPLVLPDTVRIDRVWRAIAGYTIFTAAYQAENVRSGLQVIPKGQQEAALALGLNTPLTLIFIILPQALRIATPTIVGQFISLFKDTSLLAIVGLVDLLGMAQSILANPKYLGLSTEVYLFLALIYGGFCYAMSKVSKSLESS